MGEEESGPPGGILWLLGFVEEHRPALMFDFRRYFGLSLDDLGEGLPWGEGLALIQELQREWGSHLFADLSEWEFAASYGEVMAGLHVEAFANKDRDKKQQPIKLPHPWPDAAKPKVTAEERAQLEARLASLSVFK